MRIRRKWWPHYYEMDSAYPKENANQHLPLTKNKKSVEKFLTTIFCPANVTLKIELNHKCVRNQISIEWRKEKCNLRFTHQQSLSFLNVYHFSPITSLIGIAIIGINGVSLTKISIYSWDQDFQWLQHIKLARSWAGF